MGALGLIAYSIACTSLAISLLAGVFYALAKL